MSNDNCTMKLILQALLFAALSALGQGDVSDLSEVLADSHDGVAHDAFGGDIHSSYFMYQKYTHLDSSSCDENVHVTAVDTRDAILVYNVDFSRGYAQSVSIQMQAFCGIGTVTELLLHLDSETATPFAKVIVTDTGFSWPYSYFSAAVEPSPEPGLHRVYITFASNCPQNPIVLLHLIQFCA